MHITQDKKQELTMTNMARHLHRFHVNSKAEKEVLARASCRREAVKGRCGDVLSPGEGSGDGKEGEERDEDDEGLTVGEEEETGGESTQGEEDVGEQTNKKKKRLSETQCQLCEYRGTEDRMTRHIIRIHITPPNEP